MSNLEDILKTIGKYSIYFIIFGLIITGLILLNKSYETSKLDNKDLYLYKAIIKNVTCNEKIINTRRTSRILFDCNLLLEFTTNDNNKLEKNYRKDSNIKYNNGDMIDIYYNNKTDTILETNPAHLKNLLFILSIICFISAILLYKFRKSEIFRYYFGIRTILN
jgi:hypothetical protein